MELFEACQTYFSDGGNDAVQTIEVLDKVDTDTVNVRVSFNDETVSDWKLTLDEDGTVLDGYCYNDVI
jgi:hypothetical protein